MSASSGRLRPVDPTTRLLDLVTLFQRRDEWSSTELAERLGVTTRTIRRDVTRLRDLGYAVEATPGVYGGYRLAGGEALPPLVLTDDEAVSLAVGLRAATVSGVLGVDEIAVSALAKLENLLPARLRARVSALGVSTVTLAAPGEAGVDPETLAVLALACRRRERVLLGYRDRGGRVTRRDVDPHRLVNAGPRWYLVAHDVRKAAWRTFRVDRVTDAFPTGARIEVVDPPDAAALVAKAVSSGPYQWQAAVRLALPHDHARRLIPPTTGMLAADGEDATVLQLGADDLRWVAHYLVGLDCDFEVLEPPDLVDELRELGRRLQAWPATPLHVDASQR